jgi:hypothetical protein
MRAFVSYDPLLLVQYSNKTTLEYFKLGAHSSHSKSEFSNSEKKQTKLIFFMGFQNINDHLEMGREIFLFISNLLQLVYQQIRRLTNKNIKFLCVTAKSFVTKLYNTLLTSLFAPI